MALVKIEALKEAIDIAEENTVKQNFSLSSVYRTSVSLFLLHILLLLHNDFVLGAYKDAGSAAEERTMSFKITNLAFFFPLLLLLLPSLALALNGDGLLLISLKRSILGDPLSVFANWNFNDATPCSWRGVTCTDLGTSDGGGGWPDLLRVTALALPGSQLLGSIPDEIGRIQHLRLLDLSSNFFNGSLPFSIFNASELQILSLSNNVISGELPESIGGLKSLQVLNLSDNALAGNVPGNLTGLRNLTFVSLRSNYFTGDIPRNFSSVEVLDLSSNLLNGSLPANFGGEKLQYLNFSYNKISGHIPPEFAKRIPANATIDVAFNNLTGAIPQSLALFGQKTEAFAGNEDLCGKPLKHLCSIPSSLTTPPNVTDTSSSSPAIAAIPKTIGSVPATQTTGGPNGTQDSQPQNSMKPVTIAVIAIGDLAGVAILAVVILYVYHHRKQKTPNSKTLKSKPAAEKNPPMGSEQNPQNQKKPSSVLFCLANKGEETSEATSSSDGEENREKSGEAHGEEKTESKKNGVLVTVDGETELELETLLKASAYILGASGGSIVYKAVLEDGTAFAVRRIGDGGGAERMRDFESQVRAIAKIRHQNLVKIRGFFWGDDEKLIIYDYVTNGCLAGAIHRKPSSSSSSQSHLPLEGRLKIARGIARGLAFIHDKKAVHGNIKPSNILLNSEMEALIADLGLHRLISGSSSGKMGLASGSARNFGSHRSTPNREHQDGGGGGSPAVSIASGYQAPESLKNLKPSPKWDVYSFGVMLLELMSGRMVTEREVNQWSAEDDEGRIKKMTDSAIRGEVEGKEEAMMGIFRLGFNCVCFVPQKRPTMKDALQVLDKMSAATISSSSR